MEKSRKTKKAILLVLLLLVIALSIGFAAFDSQMFIKSSATVTGDSSSFSVVFSTSKTESKGGTPTMSGNATDADEFTAGVTTVEGLVAEFTNPGQTATWEMYAYNAGEHDAYLNDIVIGAITGTAKTGTTQDKVDSAVDGMKISITIGEGTGAKTFDVSTDDSNQTLGSHKLAKGSGEKVTVTLEYTAGSAKADGDFDVSIGDIKLVYESAD